MKVATCFVMAVATLMWNTEVVAQTAVPHEARKTEVQKQLEKKVELHCVETPLREIVQFLKKRDKINIHVEHNALRKAGIDSDLPITCKFKDVPLRQVLELILSDNDLGFYTTDTVVVITTKEVAKRRRADKK